ncbi:MAG: glycosyltransferase [Verrucomicrobia bacterium]|jgi:glycosyltransferase involved in cell wall biosynthesis|nr:glycosyltransferase [Verrucomicrobiota bacterium]
MKILFASTNLPDPPHSGGAQRTELLYRSLCEIGSVECVFLLPKLPTPTEQAALQSKYNIKYILTTQEITDRVRFKLLHSVLPPSVSSDIQSFFQAGRHRWRPYQPVTRLFRNLGQYDLIVARYLQVAATFDLFRSDQLIIDLDDYDPDRLELRMDRSSLYKQLTLKRSMHFSHQAHKKLLKKVRYTWVSNPHDRKHPGLETARTLPNIPFPDFLDQRPKKTAPPKKKPYFLMVGSMNYSANVEAVDQFITNCWNKLIESFPKAEFRIVGSNMDEKQIAHWGAHQGIIPIGFADDLSSLYNNALAVVAPIQFGAGTNIKVLEAAAFGCATVLTPVARRGFERHLIHKESCLVAKSDTEITKYCSDLLREPELAVRLGRNARAEVLRYFNYDTFCTSVHTLCQRALAG